MRGSFEFLSILTSIECKFSVDSDIADSPEEDHKCEDLRILYSLFLSSQVSNGMQLFSKSFPRIKND